MSKMRVPKVAFSDSRGVFLGFQVTENERREFWSFLNSDEVSGKNLAPTFGNKDEFKQYLNAAIGTDNIEAWCQDLHLEDCPTASGPGGTATSENCKDSSIPGWD